MPRHAFEVFSLAAVLVGLLLLRAEPLNRQPVAVVVSRVAFVPGSGHSPRPVSAKLWPAAGTNSHS